MSTHSKIQLLLYEYVHGGLAADDVKQVEAHIATCQSCTQEVTFLKQFIVLTMEFMRLPSDDRPAGYWENFAAEVEQKILDSKPQPTQSPVRWYEDFLAFLTLKWRPVAALSGAVSLAVLAIIVWQLMPATRSREVSKAVTNQPTINAQQAKYDERIADYFRRSKMLLIGVTNMKIDDSEPADLSTEREVSRELVHEARYLKQQPIDYRSAQLIDDLQKILIELANAKEQGSAPNVDLVRTGIHQENLLFKIRMAETLFDTARFATADQKFSEGRQQ